MFSLKSLPFPGGRISGKRLLWLLFCGFMTVLFAHELWNVHARPELYAQLWGAVATSAFWQYSSREIYILSTAALAVWFLAGVGLALWRRPAGHILLRAHVVLSLLWLVSTMLQGREFC
ncbi:hypothetical protein [uncultured Desulfovibrio sp.]|uniref:hypothetical protein n=1 Tax=uncultured Desulfovibrio sp. TaxID=167968 RepID=UPI002622751B|nr:hypothetical protein [uncultured Desulfovibrio sp.]